MSLYNMIHGVNPAAFFVLPMLGKHPDEYPRFRDCWTEAHELLPDGPLGFTLATKADAASPKDAIYVYTRVGGNNREGYEDGIAEMRAHPQYLRDYDDDFDSTFATFVFAVPAEWRTDFALVRDGRLRETSEAYKQRVLSIFPKAEAKLREALYGTTETKDADAGPS